MKYKTIILIWEVGLIQLDFIEQSKFNIGNFLDGKIIPWVVIFVKAFLCDSWNVPLKLEKYWLTYKYLHTNLLEHVKKKRVTVSSVSTVQRDYLSSFLDETFSFSVGSLIKESNSVGLPG